MLKRTFTLCNSVCDSGTPTVRRKAFCDKGCTTVPAVPAFFILFFYKKLFGQKVLYRSANLAPRAANRDISPKKVRLAPYFLAFESFLRQRLQRSGLSLAKNIRFGTTLSLPLPQSADAAPFIISLACSRSTLVL